MGAVKLGSTAGYNEGLMWLEKMVGESWREAGAGCFGPPETPHVLMGSLIEGSQRHYLQLLTISKGGGRGLSHPAGNQ